MSYSQKQCRVMGLRTGGCWKWRDAGQSAQTFGSKNSKFCDHAVSYKNALSLRCVPEANVISSILIEK